MRLLLALAATPWILLGAALPAKRASAQAQDEKAVVRQLVERSGVAAQLKSAAESIVKELRQARDQVPEQLREALVDAGREGFRAEAMVADVEKTLADSFAVIDMRAAIAWLETDLGRRVTRAEEVAAQTMDDDRLQEYLKALKESPLSEARIALIKEVMDASDAIDYSTKVAEQMTFGVAFGMNSAQPREKQISTDVLRKRLEEAMPRDQFASMMAETIPVSTAYSYKDVSDTDLAAYVKFMRTAVGTRYVKAVNEAILQAIGAASFRTGKLIDLRSTKIRT